MATLISDPYFTTALILIVVLFYKYVLYPAVISPLSKVPTAHWSCSVSPLWILWARFKSRENRTLHAAHKRHGPIVRVGPNELSVMSVEAVKTIYQGGYQGGFDKHQWYSVFNNYGVPCTFSSAQSKPHSTRKRMVSHVYSKSYINSSPALAAQALTILNAYLLPAIAASASAARAPHGTDVHSLFCATATDFVSAYCFGLRRSAFFIRDPAYREHWLALYATRKGQSFFAQELPRLNRLLGFLGVGLTPRWVDAANRELEAWCKKHSDATLRFLEREAEGGEAHGDVGNGTAEKSAVNTADDPVVIRALLAGLRKDPTAIPIPLTTLERTVASEILDHVLAGQETTGVAMTYLSYHLSQSPALQHQLRAELRALSPTNMELGGGGADKAAHPDSRALDALPLLHAVVLETVRRYAPAGGPEPRVVPPPSRRLGPYQVPAGVRVSASPYNVHRDEDAFPDPETWDHTRWLPGPRNPGALADPDGEGVEVEKEKEKDLNRHFWGFSSGGRMCLGSNFAMHGL
ncbi:cytochrome P450 [Hypoxylon sp. NC1633]|nr:cytochrome P450 [Hypoxylon sp. NC1633]